MCVTLWQDFIGAGFLASLAPRAADAHAAGETVEADRRWTLDLHSAAASSKPSPYLPVCVVATAAQPPPASSGEQEGEDGDGGTAAGGGVLVAAWCDRAGRPLVPGEEPIVLNGQKEVRFSWKEQNGICSMRMIARFVFASPPAVASMLVAVIEWCG